MRIPHISDYIPQHLIGNVAERFYWVQQEMKDVVLLDCQADLGSRQNDINASNEGPKGDMEEFKVERG
jgi:hypothetical protein